MFSRSMVLLGFSLGASSALALAPTDYQEERNGFTASMALEQSYDDNYLTETNAQADWVTSLRPQVEFKNRGAASVYEMSVSLNQRFISVTQSESLLDANIQASAEFRLDERHRVGFDAEIDKTQSVQNVYTPGIANEFTRDEVNAKYQFGGDNARGNFEFGAGYERLRSDNGVNLEQERDVASINGAFLYRNSPKTTLTAEAELKDYQYVSSPGLDGQTVAALLGMRWQSSAKLTRYLKVGAEQRSYEQAGKGSINNLTWEARSEWQPTKNAKLGFETSQRLEEGYSGADLVDSKRVATNWAHRWNPRFVSNVSAAYESREFSNNRDDAKVNLAMKMQYQLKRWLNLQMGIEHVTQESDDDTYDYQQNVYTIGVEGKL